jgi:hypothetical protein
MVQTHTHLTPAWKATSSSASQEIVRNLFNPKLHCRVHNILSPAFILSQTNPLHAFACYFKDPFYYYPPIQPSSFSSSLSFSSSHQNVLEQ